VTTATTAIKARRRRRTLMLPRNTSWMVLVAPLSYDPSAVAEIPRLVRWKTWSWMSDTRGVMTTVTPSDSTAGSW